MKATINEIISKISPFLSAVLFDFDGVIAESVQVKTQAFAKLYEDYGNDVVEKVVAHHQAHGGISRFEKIRIYHRDFLGKEITDEELETLCQEFSDLALNGVIESDFVPGVIKTIEHLCKKYSCFVVSGTPLDELRVIIEKRNLQHYFKALFGAPTSKTDIINHILSEYGFAPASVVFIGDSMTDYDAARETSIKFIGRVPDNERSPFPPDTYLIRDFE